MAVKIKTQIENAARAHYAKTGQFPMAKALVEAMEAETGHKPGYRYTKLILADLRAEVLGK